MRRDRRSGWRSLLLVALLGIWTVGVAGSVVYEVYRVKPGDTLDSVARIFGTDTRQLVDLNPFLQSQTLTPGELITVPMQRRVRSATERDRSATRDTPAADPPGTAPSAAPGPVSTPGSSGANGAAAPSLPAVQPPAAAGGANNAIGGTPTVGLPTVEAPADSLQKDFTLGGAAGRLGMTLSNDTPIQRERGAAAAVLYRAPRETALVVQAQLGAWYKVAMADGTSGYVQAQFVQLTPRELVPAQQAAANTRGVAIIQHAYRYLGVPYRWGGNGFGGIDCSGLVLAAYRSVGGSLPRVSRDQYNVGTAVAPNQLQAGDRLYFASNGRRIDHTGLYIGNGQFIHASGGRRMVCIDSLFDPKWWGIYVGAKR